MNKTVLTLPAAILKREIEPLAKLYGKAGRVTIDGKPQAVELATFAGALNPKSGLYEGEYQFRPVESPGSENFDNLPGYGREFGKPFAEAPADPKEKSAPKLAAKAEVKQPATPAEGV